MEIKANVNSDCNKVENIEEISDNNQSDINVYIEKMNIILNEISEISSENNIVPIILMHERFFENEDGNIIMEMDEVYKKAFKECCAVNNINVIDASSDMVAEYKENSGFSYGFSNSTPGEGHLNKTGHRIVAETVYKYINEMEGLR